MNIRINRGYSEVPPFAKFGKGRDTCVFEFVGEDIIRLREDHIFPYKFFQFALKSPSAPALGLLL